MAAQDAGAKKDLSFGICFSALEGGGLVGAFARDEPPLTVGSHAYTPFRGVAHLQMVEAIRAGLRVKCWFEFESERIVVEVSDIPSYGRLSITEVRRAG